MIWTDTACDRSFSCPSNRIPLEIWAKIFIECLPSQPYIQPDPRSAPLLLCKVSKAWRSTALSLSNLWSSISVTTRHNSDVERQLEDVGAWLGRSGVQPLAISLSLGGIYWGIDPNAEVDLDPMLDLFISFIGCWENVHLELVGPFRGSISSIHLLRAPLLRRFKAVFEYGSGEVFEPLFPCFQRRPILQMSRRMITVIQQST
jgi:hypothetical protein